MAECTPNKDTSVPNEEAKRIFEADSVKLKAMVDVINSDQFVRAGLGMEPELKNNGTADFADWARRRGAGDLYNSDQPMESSDITFLYAEMLRVMDTIPRMREIGKRVGKGHEFMSKLNKLLRLPQELMRLNLLGGEKLWNDAAVIRSRSEGARERHMTFTDDIMTDFAIITGVSGKEINKILIPLENAVGVAFDKVHVLEQNKAPKSQLREAQIELEVADSNLEKVLNNQENPDSKTGKAIRAQYEMMLAMEGLRVERNENTNEVKIRKMSVIEIDVDVQDEMIQFKGEEHQVPLIVTKKVIDPNQLRMTIENIVEGNFDSTKLRGMVDKITKYVQTFGEIGERALAAEKENFVYELTRGVAQMSEAEARDYVNNKLKFNEEDIYFPRRALGMIQKLTRLRNEARYQDRPIDFLDNAPLISDRIESIERATNPHMRSRQYETQSIKRVSHNMGKVLQDYGNEMIQYWHDNMLSLEMLKHIDLVSRAWKNKIKTGEDMSWMEDYVGGLEEYLSSFVNKSKGIHTSGWLSEIAKLLTAWKVGMTMGFLNPSTPLLNLAEGQALIFTRAWKHYAFDARKENHLHIIHKLIEQEYTKVAGEEHLQQESQPALSGRLEQLGDTSYWKMAEKDTALRWLENARMMVTDGAKKGIVLQRKAENANRRKAFQVGALMEYEYILKYEAAFNTSEWTDIQNMVDVKSEGLTKQDFVSGGARVAAWNKFVRKRILRAGHEMVYQTQWNYNMVARHYFEGTPIGKMAMMFQHYPLSWVASLRRTYDILNSLRRAGAGEDMFGGARHGTHANGIRSMFYRDTRSKELDLWTNPEMMFALISGAIGFGLTGMRMGTGIVLGQMWQHPVSETVVDMVSYVKNNFNDDPDKNKTLMWGQGALQQFTGPYMSDVVDAISLAALNVGINDGSMPLWLSDVLRGTVGFRPNEILLTRYGTRQYENAWDVMTESLLWNGLSIKKKSERIAKSIPGISDKFTGREATIKDTSYAIMRAAGIRDEKGIDKWIEGQMAKDRK